jgi:hypothetical protein
MSTILALEFFGVGLGNFNQFKEDVRQLARLPTRNTISPLLCDQIALSLEEQGFWRRAAARWLVVLDKVPDEESKEAAALRRNHCSRMAANMAPKFKETA